jgi:hypothetical protein
MRQFRNPQFIHRTAIYSATPATPELLLLPCVSRKISAGEKSNRRPFLRTILRRSRSASIIWRSVRSVRDARSNRLQILSSTAWQMIFLCNSVAPPGRLRAGRGRLLDWTILSRSRNLRSAIPLTRNFINSRIPYSAPGSDTLEKIFTNP